MPRYRHGKKYFFKAPYDSGAYVSLRLDSEKFTVTEDGRYIVAAEPLTLREYYAAFRALVPFEAYVKDEVELLPDDLDKLAEVAKWARRGARQILLNWWTEDDDDGYSAEEKVVLRGDFRQWIVKTSVRGYGVVHNPYVCDPDYPEECAKSTLITTIYDLAYNYKMLQYRGAATAELIAKLFSDPKNNHVVTIFDVDELEQMLKRGFEVIRNCRKAKANIVDVKKSNGGLRITCS